MIYIAPKSQGESGRISFVMLLVGAIDTKLHATEVSF